MLWLSGFEFALESFFDFPRESGPGDGIEAVGWNRLAGRFADSVGAVANAVDGLINFEEGVLFGGN